MIEVCAQVCSEPVHVCSEYCEDMHCRARARSVGAASSSEDESADEAEVYVSTHAETLLPPELLAHFGAPPPPLHRDTQALLEDFAKVGFAAGTTSCSE